MADKQIKVTLLRSLIGKKPKIRRTLLALGLKRPRQSVLLPDTEEVRHMIQYVAHLVCVEAAER